MSLNGTAAPEPPRPKVLIADDDPLVRRILRDALEGDGFCVVAEAGTGREAAELVVHYQPDLLVLDLVMPDGDGIDVIRRVRAVGTETPIVVLTASADDEAALQALRAGAVGFLGKEVALTDLSRALHAALNGEAAISRKLGRALVDRLRTLPDGQIGIRPVRSRLTPREWEVLDLLCANRSTHEIAATLVLSIETVRSHVKSILRKMGVKNRAEAVAMAPAIRTPTFE
jgi:DNA-binding NarL/FixJ family response regulator